MDSGYSEYSVVHSPLRGKSKPPLPWRGLGFRFCLPLLFPCQSCPCFLPPHNS